MHGLANSTVECIRYDYCPGSILAMAICSKDKWHLDDMLLADSSSTKLANAMSIFVALPAFHISFYSLYFNLVQPMAGTSCT
jgi:hypothetical protein